MKKLIIVYIFILLCMISSYAQVQIPDESNTRTIQQINQEHSNTRKFISDELNRQRGEFFKQFDDRANYYENTFNDIVSKTIWKLSLLWAGVVFFIVSFNNLVRNNLEKKRFKKLKESLKGEVLRDMMVNNQGQTQQKVTQPIFKSKAGYNVETDELFNADKVMPPPPSAPEKTWVERRQEKVRNKKMMKFLKQKEKQEKEMRLKELKIRAKLGIPITEQSIKNNPQPQSKQPIQEQKADVQYSNTFEVEY